MSAPYLPLVCEGVSVYLSKVYGVLAFEMLRAAILCVHSSDCTSQGTLPARCASIDFCSSCDAPVDNNDMGMIS